MPAEPKWNESVRGALLGESSEDLYERAPCGYLSVLPDCVIGRVNRTFAEWTGFAKADLVGTRRFVDLLTVGGRIYYETHFHPLLCMQREVREIAFDVTCANGDRMPVLVNATQHDYPSAGLITRITVFDATDRRRYERELLAARKRAEQLANARAELLTTISHDIRSPLSVMKTALVLLDRSSPTAEQANFLRILGSSVAQALTLVNNLLDLSRLEAGRASLKHEPFSIRALVDEIAAAARASSLQKKALDVRTSIDRAVPETLVGDREQIGQVLMNLAMNAVKFTEQGFVALAVDAAEAVGDAAVIDFSVTDTGIGIAPDRLSRIFDEYTQASDEIGTKYGGTGLGLTISRKILQLHGSELKVKSKLGEGTTFSFSLKLPGSAGLA
jgi:PAS domain S-box-containing protein